MDRTRRLLRPQMPVAPALRANYGGPPIQVPQGMPGVRIEPSQPGALGPEQGQLVALPGANAAPAGAIPVDVVGDGNIAPGANAVLVQVQVPDTLRFRVAGIGFGADDETALGFLTWVMRENNDPQPGYTGVPAAIGSIRQLADIFHLSGSSVNFNILAQSSAGAVLTYRFICRVRGWLYATKEV